MRYRVAGRPVEEFLHTHSYGTGILLEPNSESA